MPSKSVMRLAHYFLVAVIFGFATLRGQDDASASPPPAPSSSDATGPATDTVTFQDFYDSLASLGAWIQSPDYGYVWQPKVTDPEWAPYTNGHWVYTEAGWTWDSDEPWGWATYHYGRWVNIDGTGWVWIPGYTWAPAWVSWRYGDGYAGWAPLPPDSFVGIDYGDDNYNFDVGYHIGADCDGYYGIGAAWYIFLPVNCLGYRHYHGYYCHRGDNFAIINRTTNVTNLNVGRARPTVDGFVTSRRVSLAGPSLEQVNATATTPVANVNLIRSNQRGASTLTAHSLAVYAPLVASTIHAQPAHVAGTLGATQINRGTDIMRPLAVNSRLAGATATEQQIQEARVAEAHVPASAKILTDGSSIHPAFRAPLSTMTPFARSEATPSQVYNTTSGSVIMPQHAPAAPGFSPATRTYSPYGTPTPPHTYVSPMPNSIQPHAPSTTTSTAPTYHEAVAPSPHTSSSRGTTSSTPSSGVPSGGGYSGGGASASRGGSGGSSGGRSH